MSQAPLFSPSRVGGTVPSSSSMGVVMDHPSSSSVETLANQVQGLRDELAGAHSVIGQQLQELQFLRQALQHAAVERTVHLTLKAQTFDDGLSTTSFLAEEESSTSSNRSHYSISEHSSLDSMGVKGNLRTMSLSSDASCESLHPIRIKFRRVVGPSLSSLLSSVSMVSEHPTHLQSDQTRTFTVFLGQNRLEDKTNNGPHLADDLLLFTNRNELLPPFERPTIEMIHGMATNEARENLTGEVACPEIESIQQACQETAFPAPDVRVPKDDTSILTARKGPSIMQDQETPCLFSLTVSQVTAKTSNLSSLPKVDTLKQRRKNFLAKASPTLGPTMEPRNTQVVHPSGQMALPVARIDSVLPQTDPTQYVEGKVLADAWGQKGVYTGSIHLTTALPHGHGIMVYASSPNTAGTATTDKYSGNWKQGKYHGLGKLEESGHTYEGPLQNGLKHGSEEATMTFANGRCFIGRFCEDAMREGVLQYEDGSHYQGLLKNNKRDGFGFYRFSSGDQYEGLWKNDMM